MKKALFFFILFFGLVWIFINIFYLPFFPWTEGLYRPYLILHNLVPYKDFVWIRTPFDIFFLGGLYAVFGTSEQVYQTTVFSLILVTSLLLFFGFKNQKSKLGLVSFVVYVILFFPLFINSEIGEILVGLASLLAFFFIYKYNGSRKRVYLFGAGISLGFSLITKQTAVLAAFLLLPYLYWSSAKAARTVGIKNILLYLSGLAIPVSFLTIYLWYKNAVFDFLNYAVFFNLFIYSQWAKPWGFASGIKALAVFISIFLPFLILDTRKIIDNRSKFILFLIMFSLLLSILPSFWSYRLVSAFPFVAIALSAVVLTAHSLFEHKKNIFKKTIMAISTLFFLVLFYPFLRDYISFINNNGFSWQQYILDYGENETATVDWLKKNIKSQEKIFNMANNIIMLRSNHLPHNKYTDQIPVVYYPLDKSYQDIVANPPKTVIFDRSATDSPLVSRDWIKMYKDWKFIKYLNKNYKLIKQFGAIEIYRYEKTN